MSKKASNKSGKTNPKKLVLTELEARFLINILFFFFVGEIIFVFTDFFAPSMNFQSISKVVDSFDLLVIAGITITFYAFLYNILTHIFEPAKENKDTFLLVLNVFILFNIIFVSISIIFLLYSLSGYDYLFELAFGMLLKSWLFNLAILLTFFITNIVFKSVIKEDNFRKTKYILGIGIFICGMIYIIAGSLHITHF